MTLAFGAERWQAHVDSREGHWQVAARRRDSPAGESVPAPLTLRDACWSGPGRESFRAECDGIVETVTFALQGETLPWREVQQAINTEDSMLAATIMSENRAIGRDDEMDMDLVRTRPIRLSEEEPLYVAEEFTQQQEASNG